MVVARTAVVTLLVALLALLAGCKQAGVERLVVRGGPSLDALFADLEEAYTATNPDVEIINNFSCPPCIMLKDDTQSVSMDVFASVGQFEVDRLRESGIIEFGDSVIAGATPLALVTTERLADGSHGLADLHADRFKKIGVGDPSRVAVGYYAKQALEKAGLWSELSPRLVYSQSGCELLKWLALGREIDAAIVFGVCRHPGEMGSTQYVHEFSPDVIPPVPLILAISSDALNPVQAEKFIQFVTSPEAEPILRRHNVRPVDNHD